MADLLRSLAVRALGGARAVQPVVGTRFGAREAHDDARHIADDAGTRAGQRGKRNLLHSKGKSRRGQC